MSTKTLQIATLDDMEGVEVKDGKVMAEIDWNDPDNPKAGYFIQHTWIEVRFLHNLVGIALENEDGIARDAADDRQRKETP